MPSNLDQALVRKAVQALLQHEEKKHSAKNAAKPSLVGYHSKPILTQIQLINPITKKVVRPVRVKIPHTLFSADNEDHTICFFCKSEEKESIDKHISDHPIPGLTTVLSINQVRKLYKDFKDRKKLLADHTHFVCDARVMSQLYNLLGNVFSKGNNYPLPVDYSGNNNLAQSIQKAVDSSYMHMSGSNITIRFGLTSMTAAYISDNILAGLEFAVAKLHAQWNDVHSIHIKSADSVSLPIYSRFSSDALKFVKKTAEAIVEPGSAAPVDAPAAPTKATKGKKSKAAEITISQPDVTATVTPEKRPAVAAAKASSNKKPKAAAAVDEAVVTVSVTGTGTGTPAASKIASSSSSSSLSASKATAKSPAAVSVSGPSSAAKSKTQVNKSTTPAKASSVSPLKPAEQSVPAAETAETPAVADKKTKAGKKRAVAATTEPVAPAASSPARVPVVASLESVAQPTPSKTPAKKARMTADSQLGQTSSASKMSVAALAASTPARSTRSKRVKTPKTPTPEKSRAAANTPAAPEAQSPAAAAVTVSAVTPATKTKKVGAKKTVSK